MQGSSAVSPGQVHHSGRGGLGRTLALAWLVILLIIACAGCVILVPCKGRFLNNCLDPWARTQQTSNVSQSEYSVTINANLPYAGVVSRIGDLLDLIPEDEDTRVGAFIAGMKFFIDRYDALSTLIQCGYDTGSFTTATFQNRQRPWSVGFQLVVNGSLSFALEQTGQCFVGRRLAQGKVPFAFVLDDPTTTDDPGYAVCADTQTTFVGRDYTVLTFASTLSICTDLAGVPFPPDTVSPNAGPPDNLTGTAFGDTDINVRSATRVDPANLMMKVHPGTSGTVICYTDGETETNSTDTNSHWDLTNFPTSTFDALSGRRTDRPVTGYVADVYLNTHGDITTQVRPCSTSDTPSNPVPVLSVSGVSAISPPAQCNSTWRFAVTITVNYAPATLAYSWQIGPTQYSGTATINAVGSYSLTQLAQPVQNGTTTATVTVRDTSRFLTLQASLAQPVLLSCGIRG